MQPRDFQPGDYVYFYNSDPRTSVGGCIPAQVLKSTKKRVTIEANFPEGTRLVSVIPSNLELQD